MKLNAALASMAARRNIPVRTRIPIRAAAPVARRLDAFGDHFQFILCASRMINSTMSDALRSVCISRISDRSIFNASTGNCLSPTSEVDPVPKSSSHTDPEVLQMGQHRQLGIGRRDLLRHLQLQA